MIDLIPYFIIFFFGFLIAKYLDSKNPRYEIKPKPPKPRKFIFKIYPHDHSVLFDINQAINVNHTEEYRKARHDHISTVSVQLTVKQIKVLSILLNKIHLPCDPYKHPRVRVLNTNDL